ncbi:hypothetical protein [Lentilactobacillus farraginis]|nr:hypothetical protein [Lentilactobacillus farraginis]
MNEQQADALIDELDQLNKTLKVIANEGQGDTVLNKTIYQEVTK